MSNRYSTLFAPVMSVYSRIVLLRRIFMTCPFSFLTSRYRTQGLTFNERLPLNGTTAEQRRLNKPCQLTCDLYANIRTSTHGIITTGLLIILNSLLYF